MLYCKLSFGIQNVNTAPMIRTADYRVSWVIFLGTAYTWCDTGLLLYCYGLTHLLDPNIGAETGGTGGTCPPGILVGGLSLFVSPNVLVVTTAICNPENVAQNPIYVLLTLQNINIALHSGPHCSILHAKILKISWGLHPRTPMAIRGKPPGLLLHSPHMAAPCVGALRSSGSAVADCTYCPPNVQHKSATLDPEPDSCARFVWYKYPQIR